MAIFEKKMPSVGPKSPEDQRDKPKTQVLINCFAETVQEDNKVYILPTQVLILENGELVPMDKSAPLFSHFELKDKPNAWVCRCRGVNGFWTDRCHLCGRDRDGNW